MRFRSKIDTWLILLVLATGLLALTTSLPLIVRGAPGAVPIATGVFAAVVGLPAWLIAATHYTFDGDSLDIRSGPLQWRIPISQIRAVTPTRSLLSSPALSMDRLRIDYGRYQSILVSPADKPGFLRELDARRAGRTAPGGKAAPLRASQPLS
ncbi:MAG: PH domain-containing protein [Steroidobacteraceae bacterium]